MTTTAYRELKLDGIGVLWCTISQQKESAVLPADGCTDLILRDDALVVAGPSTQAFIGRSGEQGVTLGLRFLPGTADAALGMPLGRLRDLHFDAADVLTPDAQQRGLSLLRQLRDASTPEAKRIACVDLAAEYAHPSAGRKWVAVAHDAAGRGEAAWMLAQRLASSERHMHRRMVASFGYGYTTLRRVVRAERARVMLATGLNPTETAHRAGYSDQSHLSRELQRLAGTTPSSLFAPVPWG
ncbi:helix-turn-helix domain-containing protein [Leucobacter coleopterorum]|uniref:Helix-turn-helix domain-containing protein n=1 Tax=Leucobacter coleopterorum TaxID=2714933 RepID=A0ABX6JVW5_9MICO|nr:helix-turn-helix domain-containing protein [Leucobacter coleopterorum]QIM18444.1 helix-turn-helix domain-containing protein [Leucobacter coleopterorum]